jgi:hypothetical protein
VHAIWDYAESSRLAKNIAAIRDNHEPVSAYAMESQPQPVGGEVAAAGRFYGAAAVLARPDEDDFRSRLSIRIADADRDGRWPDNLVADMRRHVNSREEAFRLLDRATTHVTVSSSASCPAFSRTSCHGISRRCRSIRFREDRCAMRRGTAAIPSPVSVPTAAAGGISACVSARR